MKTTFNRIRKEDPCGTGWERGILQFGVSDDFEAFMEELIEVADINRYTDMVWAIDEVFGKDGQREICALLFAYWLDTKKNLPDRDKHQIKSMCWKGSIHRTNGAFVENILKQVISIFEKAGYSDELELRDIIEEYVKWTDFDDLAEEIVAEPDGNYDSDAARVLIRDAVRTIRIIVK